MSKYNMTCTCKKCNQKGVIDCLFVKVSVNLHIPRETQLFLTVNSLSFGTTAESSWEAVLTKNCLSHSQHLLLSRMNMMVRTYFQSLQFHWFGVIVCNLMF